MIDRSLPAPALISSVQALAGGQPIEYVFDAISLADTQALAYDVLAPGGTLIIVLNEAIPAARKKEGDNKRVVHAFGTVHTPENRAVGVEFYSRLTEWLRTGVIVVCVTLRVGTTCACSLRDVIIIAEQGRGPAEWSCGDP